MKLLSTRQCFFLACLLTEMVLTVAASAQSSKRADALGQWRQIESVLTHPRCLNCHTATDYPRQTDDRHRHQFRVLRGHEGKGVSGALCSSCHQANNQTASGVPGAPGWHLAPLSMAWETGAGSAMRGPQLCRTLLDAKKNGGRTPNSLKEHFATEPLVLWAWQPGTDAAGRERSVPSISHQEFLRIFDTWANSGAVCPAK